MLVDELVLVEGERELGEYDGLDDDDDEEPEPVEVRGALVEDEPKNAVEGEEVRRRWRRLSLSLL